MDISQEKQNFCRNVSYLRKKLNLTEAQMGKIMNVGIGTVRSLERGMIPPRLNVYILYRLHDHFHISVAALFSPWEN